MEEFLEFYDNMSILTDVCLGVVNMSILTDVCLGVVYDTPKTSFS